MSRIKALDPDVVHKIAAGEIIVSPANALKELIENSIDAGSTTIEVVVKEGGHKLLQITDNGSGINPEDLPILCKRFTTSKISQFSDLESVGTLGFRGEALASISYVSHLQVKTKTSDNQTATIAQYENGQLVTSKKSAGLNGTQILVEDLFYNSTLRKKALDTPASKSAEYQKIVDIVTKYAIPYNATFSVRRDQDTQPKVVTGNSVIDRIRNVYGPNISKNLLELNLDSITELGLEEASGYMTGLDYLTKRSSPFILFINKRLVSCDFLLRSLRKVYQEHMPNGTAHFFVYLSLNINPKNVDVNIHPTKREVHFLNESEICDSLCAKVAELLKNTSGSRDFKVQSYIACTSLPQPGESLDSSISAEWGIGLHNDTSPDMPPFPVSRVTAKPRYEYNLVRTDPKQQTLAQYVKRASNPVRKPVNLQTDTTEIFQPSGAGTMNNDLTNNSEQESLESINDASLGPIAKNSFKEFQYVQLESLETLKDEVKSRASTRLLELFCGHIFVGLVDANRGLAALQFETRLYLVQYSEVMREMFYQIGLMQFANFGTIHLGDGVGIEALASLSMENRNASLNIQGMLEMKQMLEEYFQVKFSFHNGTWNLVQLPLMLPGYVPPYANMPQFINDLALIDWTDELSCFRSVLRALAALHVPASDVSREALQHLFNATKVNLVPTNNLLSGITEIASLSGLYKVFERC